MMSDIFDMDISMLDYIMQIFSLSFDTGCRSHYVGNCNTKPRK